MRQRLAIALFVFGIGVCVYLANSAAPLRVHLVEIFFQLGFLGIASLLTWWPDLSSQVRVYGLVSLVLLGYFVRNALLNRVMSKKPRSIRSPHLHSGCRAARPGSAFRRLSHVVA